MSAVMINDIVKQWTGHASLEDIETDTLEKYAMEHPYAPSLQFLLAKKYQMIASPLLGKQLSKATAYFPSSLHLHCLMHHVAQTNEHAPADTKLNSILDQQVAQFNEDVDASAALDYEKENATSLQKDYFAAQGIEIDLSKLPQDKFTQQLRSFTAWLKVIKNKDGVDQLDQIGAIGADQEQIIAQIAEKANVPADILTESMAEIWEKQGNWKKAIATYEKLSFIFPEKSVYFASRIEHLKNNK
jgi:tetratricopeptide (TPR) repeat protein